MTDTAELKTKYIHFEEDTHSYMSGADKRVFNLINNRHHDLLGYVAGQ